MWIYTTTGFVSVVKNTENDDPDSLLVRARSRRHLEEFLTPLKRRVFLGTSPTRDYRFRACVTRQEFTNCLIFHAKNVDYSNFKEQAKVDAQDKNYDACLLRTWLAASEMQRAANPDRPMLALPPKKVRKASGRRGMIRE